MGRVIRGGTFTGAVATPPARVPLHVLQQFQDEALEWVRRCYVGAMRRHAVRRTLHHFKRDSQLDKAVAPSFADKSALATVVAQMVRLWRAGATLAELVRFGETLLRVARALAGGALRSLNQLDLEEQRLDGPEDEFQLRRRIRGETPPALIEEIENNEQMVAVLTERGLALRARLHALLAAPKRMAS